MVRSSGDARLANRLHVLQLRQLKPSLGVCALAKRAGVAVSTVRSILKRFGGADLSVGAPKAAKGAGRPQKATKRDLRCVLGVIRHQLEYWPNGVLQAPAHACAEAPRVERGDAGRRLVRLPEEGLAG